MCDSKIDLHPQFPLLSPPSTISPIPTMITRKHPSPIAPHLDPLKVDDLAPLKASTSSWHPQALGGGVGSQFDCLVLRATSRAPTVGSQASADTEGAEGVRAGSNQDQRIDSVEKEEREDVPVAVAVATVSTVAGGMAKRVGGVRVGGVRAESLLARQRRACSTAPSGKRPFKANQTGQKRQKSYHKLMREDAMCVIEDLHVHPWSSIGGYGETEVVRAASNYRYVKEVLAHLAT